MLAKREYAAKQRKEAADRAQQKRVQSAKLAVEHNTAKPDAFKSAKNKLLEKKVEVVQEEDFEESVCVSEKPKENVVLDIDLDEK